MAANWLLNAILGLIAFLFTFLFSIKNNMWQTSLFRACIGFLVFFVLGYVLRLVLNQVKIKKTLSTVQEDNAVEGIIVELGTKKVEEGLEESFQQIPLHGLHKGENR